MLRENYVSVDVWKSSRCSSTTVIANACYIADATASTEFMKAMYTGSLTAIMRMMGYGNMRSVYKVL